ncbi:MAG: NusG domain II-containing protein [Clostridiales bacterium]|nr:NusG domain II-containing protein [Clostridiales bacterium]MCD8367893.1 NusG domain II-containing protein [Clostridiales bacterium]
MGERQGTKRRKNDLILLTVVVLAGLALTAAYYASRMGGADAAELTVVVRQDGEVTATYPLAQDGSYTIVSEDGVNDLVIEDGAAWIEDADCPDQLCVKQGKIRYAGDSLICLPHSLVVEITGSDELALDGVTK